MAQLTTIAKLKGDQGDPGPQGLPGPEAVPAATAVAAYISEADPDPDTNPVPAALGAAYAPRVDLVDAFAAFGDSFTASDQEGETPWPVSMGTDLGVEVVNGGIGGMCSTDIMIRAGAFVPLVTFPDGAIPASTDAVDVTVAPQVAYQPAQGGIYHGTIAGVHGTLTKTWADPEHWTWVADTAPMAAVVLTGATEFIIDDAAVRRGWVYTFGAGRNNIASAQDPTLALAVRDCDYAARWLSTVGNDRYLILAIPTYIAETPDTTNNQVITAANQALAARHGDHWCDWQTPMARDGILLTVLAGLTPTLADQRHVNAGNVPLSLRHTDAQHLSTAGFEIMRRLIREQLARLGYIAGLIPTPLPARAGSPTAGTATDTTQPLTWSATPGAEGYRVEYKPTWADEWIVGGYTADTGMTVTGLQPGVLYDYRLTAWNIAGWSQPGRALAGKATTGTAATVRATDGFNSNTLNLAGATLPNDLGGGEASLTWDATWVGAADGQAYNSRPDAVRNALLSTAATDGHLYLRLDALPATGELIMWGRFNTTADTYSVVINNLGTVSIFYGTAIASRTALFAPVPYQITAGDWIHFSVDGTALTVYVNDVEVASATDATATTGTKWGFQLPADDRCRIGGIRLTA